MLSMESLDSKPCPLFDLPREIRDSIYDLLLQGSNFAFVDPFLRPNKRAVNISIGYDVPCEAGNLYFRRLPRWLLVCKQMHLEALEQFYRRARCVSYETCLCYGCTPPYKRCIHFPGRLLKLDRIQNLNYDAYDANPSHETSLNTWRTRIESSDSNQITIVPTYSEMGASSLGDQMLNYLILDPEHPVRKVKFSLSLPANVPGGTEQKLARSLDWRVDLSCFQKLCHRFERVVFRLVCPSSADIGKQKMNTILYTKFQDEIARVAKYLVSGENKDPETEQETGGWVLHDYMTQIRLSKLLGPISGGFEWNLDVSRHDTKRCGDIQNKGMQYCRKYNWRKGYADFDYFEPADEEVEGVISWVCKETGETMRLRSPDFQSGVQDDNFEEIYFLR